MTYMDEKIGDENPVRLFDALIDLFNIRQLGFEKPKSEYNENNTFSGPEMVCDHHTLDQQGLKRKSN